MRAVRVSVLAFVVCGAAAAGVLAAIIPARPAPINVRWRSGVTAAQRSALEQRFHLAGGRQTEGTTWAYELADSSVTNIHALVRDPAVDDTAHINRRLFRPELAFDRAARIAFGALIVGGVASLLVIARSTVRAASTSVRLPESTFIRILGAGPAVLITFALLLLLTAAVGYRPLWAERSVGLVEAARAGDTVTVFRMLNAGADPNARGPVAFEGRAGPATLTPLEAAVESRQVEVMQVLVKMGARASESDRQRLVCLARTVDAPEVAAYLESSMRPAQAPDCSRVELPAH